jgi:hypothetical protein
LIDQDDAVDEGVAVAHGWHVGVGSAAWSVTRRRLWRFTVESVRALGAPGCRLGGTVDEEVFNMSVRKFLKKLGVTAQREIELAVREQLDGGDLRGDETLDATATVTVAGLSRDVVVTGQISLS